MGIIIFIESKKAFYHVDIDIDNIGENVVDKERQKRVAQVGCFEGECRYLNPVFRWAILGWKLLQSKAEQGSV